MAQARKDPKKSEEGGEDSSVQGYRTSCDGRASPRNEEPTRDAEIPCRRPASTERDRDRSTRGNRGDRCHSRNRSRLAAEDAIRHDKRSNDAGHIHPWDFASSPSARRTVDIHARALLSRTCCRSWVLSVSIIVIVERHNGCAYSAPRPDGHSSSGIGVHTEQFGCLGIDPTDRRPTGWCDDTTASLSAKHDLDVTPRSARDLDGDAR